ncbi:MAG TPA: AgmX/PglI C-terminal domain-containing protein [Nannocystis exedens]|nr:AgmX/PglI C-terminal domain-containing protein [Nannocystis exedens]
MDDVLDCYTQAAADNPELAGKVIVAFTIAADGSVESTTVDESSTLNDETMNTCLDGKFRGWSFAKPPSGESMTLSFPFSLAPA